VKTDGYEGELEEYIRQSLRGCLRRGIDDSKIARMIAGRAMYFAEQKLIEQAPYFAGWSEGDEV
jgi:hypothetical protein